MVRNLLFGMFCQCCFSGFSQTVLLFTSHEDTYYSEYVVMREALISAGYQVEVRSASSQDISCYMLPEGTDIEATANSLNGGSYSQFQAQFEALFGSVWNESLNATPEFVPVNGSILDVPNMTSYVGIIAVGGTGALDYRLDGSYTSQGAGDRLIDASVVEQVAIKLNELAVDALLSGKPIMAQCHGASLPAFWRVPNTAGSGIESLGYSLLKDGVATGYPEEDTPVTLTDLGITHRSNDRVTVSTPHSSLNDGGNGKYKIVTTRDWYPQTVAHAARTFLNILETFPAQVDQESEVSVLILHGGAVDPSNCSHTNRNNDIPCNYGGGENLPADYTDLIDLYTQDPNDGFNFLITDHDITATLPFDKTSTNSALGYLESFDVIVFYKHWSTGVTDELLQAVNDFAENGGGVIALHHGIYNDVDGSQNKDILTTLFGAQSSATGWSANRTDFTLHATNYGHFISTNGIDYEPAAIAPASWSLNPLPLTANTSFSYLPTIDVYDELYNNLTFYPDIDFGRAVNEVTLLFSNDQNPAGQAHVSSFVRLIDQEEDGSVGRLFFMQVGERPENYLSNSQFYQIVRNATVWTANKANDNQSNSTAWNGSVWDNDVPDVSKIAVIADNYTGSGFTCASLGIDIGATLTVTSGTLDIQGDVVNEGELIIKSGASLLTYEVNDFTGNACTIERNTRYADGRYSFVGTPIMQNEVNTTSGLGGHVYTYDEAQSEDPNDLSRWIISNENDELIPSRGYTQANKQLLSFNGTPNSGSISYVGSYQNDGWHLVANPFAAAIHIDDFLDANLNTTGAIYIWDDNDSQTGRGSNDDYIVANKLGATDINGLNNENRFNFHVGTAQGFFVQLSTNAGNISFTESMRRAGNNDDNNYYRSAASPNSSIRINLRNDSGLIRQTLIGYKEGLPLEKINRGYDAPIFSLENNESIYTIKNEVHLAIQGISSKTNSLNIGVTLTSSGEYFLEAIKEGNSLDFLLKDNLTGNIIDLNMAPYYFQSKAGQIDDRFQLVSAEPLSTSLPKVKLFVFDNKLHIQYLGYENVAYRIYNMSGILVDKFINYSSAQIDLNHLISGLYVITNGTNSHKIMIK